MFIFTKMSFGKFFQNVFDSKKGDKSSKRKKSEVPTPQPTPTLTPATSTVPTLPATVAMPTLPDLTPRLSISHEAIMPKSNSDFGGDLSCYNVENKVGKGQFSEVFQAVHIQTNQKVALKKISIFEMLDAKARLDCIKEINLLQQLDHPNVIKHLTSFINQNDLYIVLELADGGDLAQLLRYFRKNQRLLTEPLIWRYFAQICDALEHMHSKRVMHRDIKPANVFMTSKGVVKLGDLGLGRFFNTGSVRADSLVGTPYYMSPERIHEAGYDFKSDIWSLGCLLYEMAALQSPFYGEKMNLYSLCEKIKACSYPPLPAKLYSQPLRNIVTACLTTNPVNRPNINEICEMVREVTGTQQQQTPKQESSSYRM